MPRICEPSDDALPLQAIDQDMEAVAKQRWPWAQPWHPRTVRIENREWVRQRSEVWKPRTKNGKTTTKWQPARHAAICMWASSARHVSGQDDEYISKLIEAKDLRTIRRAVEIGSRTWASLGAWPWTMREGGRLTADWWQLDDIWEALAAEIELRVRRAERLIAALQP